jgi:uncharacterized protein (DUF2126 family)
MFKDGVKSTKVELPMKSPLDDGDVLTCSADGNPSPRYEWINTLNNSTTEGANYVVNVCHKYQFNKLELQCIAKNNVSGKEHMSSYNITLDVNSSSCGDSGES